MGTNQGTESVPKRIPKVGVQAEATARIPPRIRCSSGSLPRFWPVTVDTWADVRASLRTDATFSPVSVRVWRLISCFASKTA